MRQLFCALFIYFLASGQLEIGGLRPLYHFPFEHLLHLELLEPISRINKVMQNVFIRGMGWNKNHSWAAKAVGMCFMPGLPST